MKGPDFIKIKIGSKSENIAFVSFGSKRERALVYDIKYHGCMKYRNMVLTDVLELTRKKP